MMEAAMDRSAFQSACKELGINLSERQLDAFQEFESALYLANAQVNLTRVSQADCWLRHFIDSLLVAEFIPANAAVLDLGTGPGFPAWPLACARPDLSITALDSNGKMLGFLRSQPLPNLTVVQARAEDKSRREEYDVVTGRALAPLAIQLELSAAPCRIGGSVIPMRTPKDEPVPIPEVGLGLELREVFRRRLAGTEVERLMPCFEKVRATDRKYPRSWAEIRR
jgi:16S rRNA (guanine527-N7)-methyltransferase